MQNMNGKIVAGLTTRLGTRGSSVDLQIIAGAKLPSQTVEKEIPRRAFTVLFRLDRLHPICSFQFNMTRRPAFSELPLNEGDPFLSAWGLYGKDDELGTLNLLTDDVVRSAATEIKDGIRIGLNWPMGQPKKPCFNREFNEHKV
jgi:hypothetical protein